MYCTRCGSELRDTDRFCSQCGVNVAAPHSAPAPSTRPIIQKATRQTERATARLGSRPSHWMCRSGSTSTMTNTCKSNRSQASHRDIRRCLPGHLPASPYMEELPKDTQLASTRSEEHTSEL